MDEVKKYGADGFVGFIKVSELRKSICLIPKAGGVYVVVRNDDSSPEFLEYGTGGHYKGKDPNVPILTLQDNFVAGSRTMYIGKATDLRKRIGQLLRFGAGADAGHWGGRFLWQLADSEELIIAWKETPAELPATAESSMLADYISKYGCLPFANLRK